MRTLLEAVREADPGVIFGLALLGTALVGAVWLQWARRPVKPKNQAYTVANIQARLEREQAEIQARNDQDRRCEPAQADTVADAADAHRKLAQGSHVVAWPDPDAVAVAENALETTAVIPAVPRPRRARPYSQVLGLRSPASRDSKEMTSA